MKRIAGISILLNVALLVVWTRMGSEDVDGRSSGQAAQRIINRTIVKTNYVEVHEINKPIEPKFNWSLAESERFEDYMFNLRRLECPEWLVKEIILAELTAYYEGRENVLRRDRPPLYWATYRERRAIERKYDLAHWELSQERYDVMKQLTGSYRHEDAEDVVWENGVMFMMLSGLGFQQSLDLFSELVFQHGYKERLDDMQNGFFTPSDLEKLRSGYKQMKLVGATMVSPGLFEEFWLRFQFVLGSFVSKFDLPGMQLTGYQLRELIKIRSEILDPIEREFLAADEPVGLELNERNRQVEERIATVLGEQLADEYGRSQNPAFQQIAEFTHKQDLPVETAIAVYDVRQTAIDQVRNLMTDPGYDGATKNELRELIQIEIEQTLESTLGSATYPVYREKEGGWIDRVGGSTPTDDAGGRR